MWVFEFEEERFKCLNNLWVFEEEAAQQCREEEEAAAQGEMK